MAFQHALLCRIEDLPCPQLAGELARAHNDSASPHAFVIRYSRCIVPPFVSCTSLPLFCGSLPVYISGLLAPLGPSTIEPISLVFCKVLAPASPKHLIHAVSHIDPPSNLDCTFAAPATLVLPPPPPHFEPLLFPIAFHLRFSHQFRFKPAGQQPVLHISPWIHYPHRF